MVKNIAKVTAVREILTFAFISLLSTAHNALGTVKMRPRVPGKRQLNEQAGLASRSLTLPFAPP